MGWCRGSEPLPDRGSDLGLERGRKARHAASRRIDHVAGERRDVSGPQQGQDVGGLRQDARQQQKLAAHGRDASGVALAQRLRGRVTLTRPADVAEEQRGLALGRVIPTAAHSILRREARADRMREIVCRASVAQSAWTRLQR